MKTSAARLTIGAYDDSTYHVAVVLDVYEGGVLRNSTVHMSKWIAEDEVIGVVLGAAANVFAMNSEPV